MTEALQQATSAPGLRFDSLAWPVPDLSCRSGGVVAVGAGSEMSILLIGEHAFEADPVISRTCASDLLGSY